MTSVDATRQQVISYLGLRRSVGILGVLLPLVLSIGCFVLGWCDELRYSISHYYHTGMQDVFVGILFAIAFFLFSYKGYEKKDDIAGHLACISAVGVALFPTDSPLEGVHFACATVLFLVLSYFSLWLFTKSGPERTPRKVKRNRVYVACGIVMLLCLASIAVFSWRFRDSGIAAYKPVFWLESLALWAFGVSWITKGQMLRMLWRDDPAA